MDKEERQMEEGKEGLIVTDAKEVQIGSTNQLIISQGNPSLTAHDDFLLAASPTLRILPLNLIKQKEGRNIFLR